MSEQGLIRYPEAPTKFGREDVDKVLVWAAKSGVSDIVFATGEPVWVKHHGRRVRATTRELTSPEVGEIINLIYGNNGTAQISSGKDVDTGYSVKDGRFDRYRFRFNGTGIMVDGSNGFSITLRSIPSVPPSIEDLQFPMHLLEPMCKSQGMCIITGETGSGKSTLQASVLRHRVEQEDANLNVITFEAPIEFMFSDVLKPSSRVEQSEIPRNLPSFEAGIRNAMRRDPDIILIGESRDRVTMAASVDVAKSGHLLMTTMHSNGVPSTIRRAVGMFPEGERNGTAIDIIEFTNIILTQRLLRTVDGKRKPIREFLIFDDHIRDILLQAPVDQLPAVSRDLTKRYGQTLADDAKKLLDDGQILEKDYLMIAAKEKSVDADSAVKIRMTSDEGYVGKQFFDDLSSLTGEKED